MKLRSVLCLAALASCFLGSSVARADFDFTFSSTPTITSASATPPGTVDTISNGITIGGLPGATFTSVAASGTSTIELTGRNTLGPFDATFGTVTPFLNVLVTSNDSTTRDFSLAFDIAYTIADPTPSGGPGPQTVHFVGSLSGLIDGRSPTSTNLSFNLGDFNPSLGNGFNVTTGDGQFHITLDSFQNPGLGADQSGGLSARVGPARSPAVPEPASAVLLSLGAIGLLFFRRRVALAK